MALTSVRTLATAAFVVVTLLTVSTPFAQESSKSEESARETKEEIRSILSDIEKRRPSSAPAMIQPFEVRTVSAGVRRTWQPFLALAVALALGMVGLIVLKARPVSPRAKRRARR
jgi:Flp pilus assembly protein TadB